MTAEILSLLDRMINDLLDRNTQAITRNDTKQIVATANQMLALLDAKKEIQRLVSKQSLKNMEAGDAA